MIDPRLAVIDTETTGLEATDEVIEVGVVTETLGNAWYFSASKPIPAEVSAVHHIVDADVAGRPLFRDYAPVLRDELHRNGVQVLVAHNADFDRKMLGEEFVDFEWICTFKCALHVFPDAPNHKNETLCYHLGVGALGRSGRSGNAHSAQFDACQTKAILEELLKHASIEQMIAWTKDIKNIQKLPFGKHAGKKWAEIDGGYLMWMIKAADMDPDMRELASRELKRRR